MTFTIISVIPFMAIFSKKLFKCLYLYSLFVLKRNFPEAKHFFKLSTDPIDLNFHILYTPGEKIIGLCSLIHDYLNIQFLRLHFSVLLCFIQDTLFQQISQTQSNGSYRH